MARSTTGLVLTTLFLKPFAQSTNPTTSPIVTVDNIEYHGLHNATFRTNTYFNVPFAAPPVGPLRWKAPEPYVAPSDQPSKTISIDATKRGPSCVQGAPVPFQTEDPASTVIKGSEDCLTLHVFTPDTATPDSKLPVVFHIHGGGYVVGAAAEDNQEPYALLQHSGEGTFIYVSVQYRLGAYGFLGGPKYAAMGGAPNLGIMDQRLGLEWTRKNIAAFGGDPDKVTIMGGSAGGGSVTAQMMWAGGEDAPFRAALADYPWTQQFLREEQLDRQFEVLLDATGCSEGGWECLQDVPEEKMKNATQATYTTAYWNGDYGYGTFYYGPYVDGEFLRGLPSTEFRAGRFSHVPTMVNRAGYEGFVVTNFSASYTLEDEKADLRTQFPYADQALFDELYKLYPSDSFNSTPWHRQTWFGDFVINCPTHNIAASLADLNIPVYKHVFNAGTQIHGAVSELTNTVDYASRPNANVTLADVVKDYYASFLLHMDPNAESWSDVEKPVWPEYRESGGVVMSFNFTEIGGVEDRYFDATERCAFWKENGAVMGN
ncbi:unnamed protein product [Periconia digitata]|uniref:Carboxylic ester hydrolase n=1 Tax=Periconia digitata TaxID=1303443 RepID=A0A9W4UE06_9PLEO|nr:unnamed protein product [Periconia digitata]